MRPLITALLALGSLSAAVFCLDVTAPLHAEECFQVVVHPDNAVSQLELDRAGQMLLKKVRRWPDGSPVVPVDQQPTSAAREAFSRQVLERSPQTIRRYWQRMTFSGRETPPLQLAGDREVLEHVRAEPGAIGYVGCSALPYPGVKGLTLDAEKGLLIVDRRAAVLWPGQKTSQGLLPTVTGGSPDPASSPPARGEARPPAEPPEDLDRESGEKQRRAAEDTPEKRALNERQLVRLFVVEHLSATEVSQWIAHLTDVEKVVAVEQIHALLARGTAAQIATIEHLLETIDRPRAEIEIDVGLLLLEGKSLEKQTRAFRRRRKTDFPHRLSPRELSSLHQAARLLAEPRLTALDRSLARWQWRQRWDLDVDGESSPVDLGLALTARPRAHESGDLTLEIAVGWTDLGPREPGSEGPTVESLAGEWSARLEPGESLLVSGLLPPQSSRGPLASSLAEGDGRSELLLTLTPRISRGLAAPEKDLEIICAGTRGLDELCGAGGGETPKEDP